MNGMEKFMGSYNGRTSILLDAWHESLVRSMMAPEGFWCSLFTMGY